MSRGFQIVSDSHRFNKVTKPTVTEYTRIDFGGSMYWVGELQLPTRADARSAGYDFYLPTNMFLPPKHQLTIWTDVKAYMEEDEVLQIYVRSSLALKYGLSLVNKVGIIDSSYYENPTNDGNIGVVLTNESGTAISMTKGERFAQGIFQKYLTIDNDTFTSEERTGGFGSSGK